MCSIVEKKSGLTLEIGIFLTQPVIFEESAQAITMLSSSPILIKPRANEGDLAVSSFEVAMRLISSGLELMRWIW